jgi:hypothetical protein
MREAKNDKEIETIFRLKWPKAVSQLSTQANFFAEMVNECQQHEAWRQVGFDSFEDFCHAKLDMTLDEVETIVRGVMIAGGREVTRDEAVVLGKHGGDHGNQHTIAKAIGYHGGDRQGSNPILATRGRDYTLARLHRDRPDLANRVESGELSANAAAIEAGFRKKPTPLDDLRRAWKKADAQQRKTFLEEIP